jgi:hypothetical protein
MRLQHCHPKTGHVSFFYTTLKREDAAGHRSLPEQLSEHGR